jgi:hypothetical protein
MSPRWLLLLVVACGTNRSGHDETKQGAQAGSAASSGSAAGSNTRRVVELPEPEVALPKELAFELLEAGADGRTALRYALAAEKSHYVIRTELTTRELDGGVWGAPSKLPALITALDVGVERDRRTSWQPAQGSLDGAASPAAQAYLEPWNALAGRAFDVPLDVRGRLTAPVDHDAASEELVQRLLATVVPLPEQPIGVGARWRVVTALRQQSAVLKQTATYTLVSAQRPWKIAVDIQRLAESQRFGDVELVAIVRRLTGTVEVDPQRPLPVAGTLEVKSTVHVRSGNRENIVEDTGSVKIERKAGTSSTSR